MPTSSVRLIVVGLTFVLAVFTGLVTGFIAGGPGCSASTPAPASNISTGPSPSSPVQGPAGQATPTEAGEPAGPNNNVPANPDNTAEGNLPGITEELTVKGGATLLNAGSCEPFSPLTAAFGFLGALLTGAVVGGTALFLPRTGGEAGSGDPSAGGGLGIGQPVVPARAASHSGAGLSHTATGSHPVLTDLGSPGVETKRLAKERMTLVETCIYVRDRATSKAIGDRLGWALNEVGVVEDRPAGEPFDTARHEAGGTAPTDDHQLAGKIAGVEISGYNDRGQILRAPVVTVYRSDVR
jgi:hypothetical protein